MTVYDILTDFLRIRLDLSSLDKTIKASEIIEGLFDRSEIEQIIPDRAPFQMLDRAIIFKDRKGKICVLARSTLSEEDCAGHIAEQAMIPLIKLSQIIALSGRLLSAFGTGGNNIVAEVMRTGRVSSLITDFTDLKYTKPPADIISFARLVKNKKKKVINKYVYKFLKKVAPAVILNILFGGWVSVDSRTWIISAEKFVPAGEIKKLKYAIIPKKVFLAALRG